MISEKLKNRLKTIPFMSSILKVRNRIRRYLLDREIYKLTYVLFEKLNIPKAFVKNTKSYAQFKEDVFILYLLKKINITDIYYVEIGACHPYVLSNTALFYENNIGRGILIEANPMLIEAFSSRPEDTIVNIAIGENDTESIDFFVLDSDYLCTCDKHELERLLSVNHVHKETISVKCANINTVLEEHAKRRPNFISLDIEGFDEIVIDTLNFEKWGPEVLCVETFEYAGLKKHDFIEHICSKGYCVYVDTTLNTIFLKKELVHLIK